MLLIYYRFIQLFYFIILPIAVTTSIAWLLCGFFISYEHLATLSTSSHESLRSILGDTMMWLGKLLVYALISIGASAAILKLSLAWIIKRCPIYSSEIFNPITSMQITTDRDGEFNIKLISYIIILSIFLIVFWGLYSWWATTTIVVLTILFLLILGLSTFLLYNSIQNADVKRTYYCRTKEFHDFHLSVMFQDYSDEAEDLFQLIPKDNSDYPIAAQIRAYKLGQEVANPIKYDYIGGGDPSIQYGPTTDEQREQMFRQMDEYENSDIRIG